MATSNGRHFDTVTLDMGYTLVDLPRGFDQELVELAAQAGFSRTLDDVHEALRRVWEEQARLDATRRWAPGVDVSQAMSFEIDRSTCLYLGITDPEIHRAAHARAQAYFQNTAAYRVFPDVFETLAALRSRGVTLGIISNWDWWLPETCDTLHLSEHFDFILSSARVGAAKPNPAIFEEALRRAGSAPARTLHVGDSLVADVRGAQDAGITGVLLDREGRQQPGDFPVVRSLSEIVPMLNGMERG